MTEDDAPNNADQPLTDDMITTTVARIADMILCLTQDPEEHVRIVDELGEVLDNWENGFPFAAHPYDQKDRGGREKGALAVVALGVVLSPWLDQASTLVGNLLS